MDILDKYGLTFFTRTDFGKTVPSVRSRNSNSYIPIYLNSNLPHSVDYDEYIEELDVLISQQTDDIIEGDTEIIAVSSDKTSTSISGMSNPTFRTNPDFSLPTQDFRDIMVEWKKFVDSI